MSKTSLAQQHCQPIKAGTPALQGKQVLERMRELNGWTAEGGKLVKPFSFKNYYETMAFVNAVAWVSHREDHHPDLEVGYNKCKVTYSTHSAGGLSENDFICAARVEELMKL